ncbi:MAG: YvcK family protein [Chloroflexota bacterium]|nr:YvcK family protein [Chloroflexota bacterium]
MNKWLPSGYGFRRWALVLAVGVAVLGLGLAMGIANLYRIYIVPRSGTEFLYFVTLQFIPHPFREALVLLVGIALALWGGVRVNRAARVAASKGRAFEMPVLSPMRAARRPDGIKIVAIGGGTGMPTLLRGLKEVTDNITAVVNVVDDGGSSGRLRRDLGILPPGDFRNNLVALSEVEPLMAELFQYRFEGAGDLEGHSFGNLFLVALNQITGSFEQAILESSRVLAIKGKVLPASLTDIELYAELQNGQIVRGESLIPHGPAPIKRIFMDPPQAPGYPEAMLEILNAEVLVFGPGSLYTSIMPPLLVQDIASAVKANKRAVKVFICNVATQPGETDGFGVTDHVRTLRNHIGPDLFDYVLYNSNQSGAKNIKPEWGVTSVTLDTEAAARFPNLEFIPADVVRDDNPLRHDPVKLADAVLRLYENRGGKGAPGRVREREREQESASDDEPDVA